MHGLGNDYIFINCLEELVINPSRLAKELCRRNFSIGADGLVLVSSSSVEDFSMRIFNADGSEAQMCGNAIRCFGKYVYEKGLSKKTSLRIETLSGVKELELSLQNDKVVRVKADMGAPIFKPSKIPVNLTGDAILNQRIYALGEPYFISAISMGNPHAVVFVDDVNLAEVEKLGPAIENLDIFPEKANVSFVKVARRDHLEIRVWERGCKETLACGTGACASLVAAVSLGLCDRTVLASLPGGNLELSWCVLNNHVFQAGPVSLVFDGEILI